MALVIVGSVLCCIYVVIKWQYRYQNNFVRARIEVSNEKLLRGIVMIEKQIQKEKEEEILKPAADKVYGRLAELEYLDRQLQGLPYKPSEEELQKIRDKRNLLEKYIAKIKGKK